MTDDVPATLPAADFPRAKGLRHGYAVTDVDRFVAELRLALDHEPPGMAPYEVADARFHLVRRHPGYDLRSVDQFMDQAQALLRERHGADAVAALDGHTSTAPRHVSTLWIYIIALVLILGIVAFVLLAM